MLAGRAGGDVFGDTRGKPWPGEAPSDAVVGLLESEVACGWVVVQRFQNAWTEGTGHNRNPSGSIGVVVDAVQCAIKKLELVQLTTWAAVRWLCGAGEPIDYCPTITVGVLKGNQVGDIVNSNIDGCNGQRRHIRMSGNVV